VVLNPLDFEEFLWAKEKTLLFDNVKNLYLNHKMIDEEIHISLMKEFRLYMLIGGMPGVVSTYLTTNNYVLVEEAKQNILNLYRADLGKASAIIREKTSLIFESIPAQLSKPNKKFLFTEVSSNAKTRYFDSSFRYLEQAKMINVCNSTNFPTLDLKSNIDYSKKKIYFLDTGLLITLAFQNNLIIDTDTFKSILLDKIHINEGMFFENIIAQQLVANNHNLVYYYSKEEINSKKYVEVDFLIQQGRKISLVEGKSSNYKDHSSLDKVLSKFSNLLEPSYIVYSNNIRYDAKITYLPVYLVSLL
jgi:hypothetical protein